MSLGKVFFAVLILVLTFVFLESAMAREEPPGKLIATFTLNRDNPVRTFFDGNLKVELVSANVDELMKTVKVRISSRALKAEFGDTWQEHTYLEMLKYNLGDPVSGSPFKCAEGWLYYEHSETGEVTLSLRSNPKIPNISSYNFLILFLENWKKVFMALGVMIGLLFVFSLLSTFLHKH